MDEIYRSVVKRQIRPMAMSVKIRRHIEALLIGWAQADGEFRAAIRDKRAPGGYRIVERAKKRQKVIARCQISDLHTADVGWTDPAMKPPPLPSPVQQTCSQCHGAKLLRVSWPGEERPRPMTCTRCNGSGVEWVRPEEEEDEYGMD